MTRSLECKRVTNSHALIWILGRAIVLHFHMHLWSTHDCIRGRRMNRDVRLSYAVISHTLISNIANFDLQTRAARTRCFSSGTYEYSWHFSCHAVRFSIYKALNPIFPIRRWRTWNRTEGGRLLPYSRSRLLWTPCTFLRETRNWTFSS